MRFLNAGWPLVLAVVVAALSADGTSYVMMNDGALAETASTIVEVTVVDVTTSSVGAFPVTDYQVTVEEVLKGSVSGGAIIVRVPGSLHADGLSLYIPGAPKFRTSERALLFLAPRKDGTYGLHQFGLSAFHLRQDETSTWALRVLGEALVLDQSGTPLGSRQSLRDYPLFNRWLKDRVAGRERLADYHVDLPQWRVQSIHDEFTLFVSTRTGLNMRWPDFDQGSFVEFVADQSGQPGVSGGGFSQFVKGLEIWSGDPASNIDYRYGGTVTGKAGGLTDYCDFAIVPAEDCSLSDPHVNAIIFDDPNGFFTSPFTCGVGGVLAAAGPWFDSRTPTTHTYRGQTFLSIFSADLVVNKNSGCFLNVGKSAEEVYTHELGHTLGIGHSCDGTLSNPCDTAAKAAALMNAFATGGNRGGDLGTDDQAAAAFLYTSESSIACIPDANTLCLQNDRFRVTTNWLKTTGETGVGNGVELTTDTGYFWFFSATNVEMVVKILNNCNGSSNRFWVFAGGLTNVEVDLVVEDTQTGDVQTYQNPLGTPFQPIQDTGAFATCP